MGDRAGSGLGLGLGRGRLGRRLGVGDEGQGPVLVVEKSLKDRVVLEVGVALDELVERGGVADDDADRLRRIS